MRAGRSRVTLLFAAVGNAGAFAVGAALLFTSASVARTERSLIAIFLGEHHLSVPGSVASTGVACISSVPVITLPAPVRGEVEQTQQVTHRAAICRPLRRPAHMGERELGNQVL